MSQHGDHLNMSSVLIRWYREIKEKLFYLNVNKVAAVGEAGERGPEGPGQKVINYPTIALRNNMKKAKESMPNSWS